MRDPNSLPAVDADRAPPDRAYCRRCSRRLRALDDALGHCRTCRLPFAFDDRRSYAESLHFPHWTLWLSGLIWSVLLGAGGYFAAHQYGVLGVGAFLAGPFAVGGVIGYWTGAGLRFASIVFLVALLVIGGLVFALGASSLICLVWLVPLFAIPGLLGVLFGTQIQRLVLRRMPEPPRRILLAFLLLPWLVGAAEFAWSPPPPTVVVSTAAVFDATPRATWDAIAFYEQVDHEPPLLLRVAMPVPVGVEGVSDRVGAEPRCVYERGYLVKRITVRNPERELAFDVIEQQLGMERDVILRDGRFLLTPRSDGRTTVLLETRYDAPLRPRWLWRPVERRVVRALHAHVLRGMRTNAKATRIAEPPTSNGPVPSEPIHRP